MKSNEKNNQKNNQKSKELQLSAAELEFILSPKAIRERSQKIYQAAADGKTFFQLHEDKLPRVADYVYQTIQENYPDLKIPFHSRWRHFSVGGINRHQMLQQQLKDLAPIERLRSELDLVVTSVLLDAGAGADWKFFEASSKQTFSRSEGLGVASLYWFQSGAFSSVRGKLQADADGLEALSLEALQTAFQVSDSNPLMGQEGRFQLLKNLASAVRNQKYFKTPRPGSIADELVERHGKSIPATALLEAVLRGFGSIWPGRLSSNGVNLGDVWHYPEWGSSPSFETLVPIHKLSQWLTYSLIEPFEAAGFQIQGINELTGLAEYRNGGLFIDLGVIIPRDPKSLEQSHTPDHPFILEWRALTVQLLDRVGELVQKKLGRTSEEFPLAKVLEGGTWWAGRRIAKELRPLVGGPPVNIQSDGTVF